MYCKKNRLLAGHAARKQNGLAGTDNDDAVAPATISTRLYWAGAAGPAIIAPKLGVIVETAFTRPLAAEFGGCLGVRITVGLAGFAQYAAVFQRGAA